MLLKSLTAGVIMASLAGGAVYYGLGEELSDAPSAEASIVSTPKSNAPEASTSKSAVERLVGGQKDVPSKPAKLEVKKTEDIKVNVTAKADAEPNPQSDTEKKPKKRWLDEYLKSDDVDADDVADDVKTPKPDVKVEESEEVILSDAAPEKLTVMKDKLGIKPKKAEQTETITVEEEILKDGRVKTTTTKKVTVPGRNGRVKTLMEDIEITIDDPKADSKVGSPKAAKPETPKPEMDMLFLGEDGDAEVRIIEMKPKATGSFVVTSDDGLMDILMSETEKLEIPDMRDQAYLNVVDYALSKNDRAGAKTALAKLSREELRDTARGRLAVSLARKGKSKAAFAVLDELEIEELQGPIRLQIIEALTVGKPFGGNSSNSNTWVEKN